MSRVIVNDRINRAWFQARMKQCGIVHHELAAELGLDRSSVHRAFTGERFFSATELGHISILLQQPLTEVATHAGIQFWQPADAPAKTKKVQQQEAYEAMQALARALGLAA